MNAVAPIIYLIFCCGCVFLPNGIGFFMIKMSQDAARKRYNNAPVSYANVTAAPVVGQPVTANVVGGARFDPNTGEAIPKFDPYTGVQNW